MVKVNRANLSEYEEFIKSLGIDISTLVPSRRGKCTKYKKLVKPKKTVISREERKKQKIRELQIRYHITPRK